MTRSCRSGTLIPAVVTAAAILTGACGHDAAEPTFVTADAQVSGEWTFQQETRLTATTYVRECTVEGTLAITQDRRSFTGPFRYAGHSCFGAWPSAWTRPLEGMSLLEAGDVQGQAITFRIGSCAYQGTLTGKTLAGTVRCPTGGAAAETADKGTWTATRKSG
jgi:hypothetical protein